MGFVLAPHLGRVGRAMVVVAMILEWLITKGSMAAAPAGSAAAAACLCRMRHVVSSRSQHPQAQ